MPGLVPGIQVFKLEADQDVDGRDKPDDDEARVPSFSRGNKRMNRSDSGRPNRFRHE
jgi:hypothetical protein